MTTAELFQSIHYHVRHKKTVQEHTVYLAQLKDENGCQTAAITVNHSQLSADLSISIQAGWKNSDWTYSLVFLFSLVTIVCTYIFSVHKPCLERDNV